MTLQERKDTADIARKGKWVSKMGVRHSFMLFYVLHIYANSLKIIFFFIFCYNHGMKFEYDSNKSYTNKQKHGINFEDAQLLWQNKGCQTLFCLIHLTK